MIAISQMNVEESEKIGSQTIEHSWQLLYSKEVRVQRSEDSRLFENGINANQSIGIKTEITNVLGDKGKTH